MGEHMAVTADDVRARLQTIPAPGGGDLVASGKLSDIVVTSGKVFLSSGAAVRRRSRHRGLPRRGQA
jgi:hypothetical protein